MNTKPSPSFPSSITGENKSDNTAPRPSLTKSFSYVENYHQKYYYPKIVMARIRRRCAKMLQVRRDSSNIKSTSVSLGSSLEAITSYYDNDETFADMCGQVGRNDNSTCCRLRRTCSNDNINKNIRVGYRFTYVERKFSDERRICDVVWGSLTSSSGHVGSSTEDCASTCSKDGCRCGTEIDVEDLELFIESKSMQIKRASSLKRVSNKLERIRKKCVRFADALGLELQSVRDLDTTYPPVVLPQSVLEDLRPGLEEAHRSEGTQHIGICFTQPGQHSNFFERVLQDRVALESCTVGARDLTATGTVRVANICHKKEVIVRYTLNTWVTFDDIIASYVQNPLDDTTDRFSFSIALPLGMRVGGQLMFAVRYRAVDLHQTYWDNNFCDNYRLECYAKTVPICESDSAWMHFL